MVWYGMVWYGCRAVPHCGLSKYTYQYYSYVVIQCTVVFFQSSSSLRERSKHQHSERVQTRHSRAGLGWVGYPEQMRLCSYIQSGIGGERTCVYLSVEQIRL